MRRIALGISLVLVLAACSGDASTTTATTAAVAADAPTTTAGTTMTTTTTTTVPESTTTTVGVDLSFDTVAGTPPDAFDSFAASMTITMGLGEVEIEVDAEGIRTGDAFSCTVSSGLGGLTFSESIVGTPETLWIDQGNGYEPSSLIGSAAQDIMSTCPTSPLFWASFITDEFGGASGDEEFIDGRAAVRADLADLAKSFGALGLVGGFDGAAINEMTVWIDVETNTVLAMTADIEMTEELVGDLGGTETGPVEMKMDFSLSDVNSPLLSVELP